MTADLTPGKDDLGGGGTVLLGNSLDFGTGDEERDVEEVVAKGRVCGDVDVLLLGVGDELLAGEDGVTFNLVHGGDQICLLHQSLQVLVGEIRHADGADLAPGELVDSFPCLAVGNGVVNVDLVGV